MDRVDIVIIGGGVVGCAIAMHAAERFRDVILLEALPKPGMLASTRNSGVLHSGVYYTPGSLKARLCLEGNQLSHEFCEAHGVALRRCQKLIVAATPEEVPTLEGLFARGQGNGVAGLRLLDRAEIRAREPHIEGAAAIHVPSASIVSSEDLVKAYARIAGERGASLLCNARVERLTPLADAVRVTAGEAGEIEARCVVNSAGLFADEVAASIRADGAAAGAADSVKSAAARERRRSYQLYPVRGEYAEVRGPKAKLVNGLVYPLPHPDHLGHGVHLTPTLWGTLLIGPTAHYVESKHDYEHNRLPLSYFATNARKLLPAIEEADLVPAYSGLRAKHVPPDGHGPADFLVERDAEFPRIIHLIGMESPALTSVPAIARHVLQMIEP